ncbi:MAG TPA: hypothetical protein PLV50_15360, partial [Smithella sp.]|nr:hypothetical protein [Smithella sp.]HPN87663.1 hypothetical protein [Smithella sp.]
DHPQAGHEIRDSLRAFPLGGCRRLDFLGRRFHEVFDLQELKAVKSAAHACKKPAKSRISKPETIDNGRLRT